MGIPPIVEKYERYYALKTENFYFPSCEGIEQVVVIPAFAERDYLFSTLKYLSLNEPQELKRTLVICVINDRGRGLTSEEDIKNNQETLRLLYGVMKKKISYPLGRKEIEDDLDAIINSPLRLGVIDATSTPLAGVGLARKLGMDRALTLFDYGRKGRKLLLSLDADTHVESNYLTAVRDFMEKNECEAAVVGFSHRSEDNLRLTVGIVAYEIFLRYYVLGLRWAGSPYAFHTVGSTMVCTAEAYVAVRGMSRREAGEDFYFLNKLAKLGTIGRIKETTVHPAARTYVRVPFGTAKKLSLFARNPEELFYLYDPRVFVILKRWLNLVATSREGRGEDILKEARAIEPLMGHFLEMMRFSEVWEKIRKNCASSEPILRHFHFWFDAFKTMKLIRYLSRFSYPPLDMFSALVSFFQKLKEESSYN